jgi:outer membrane protein assembly factor BamB
LNDLKLLWRVDLGDGYPGPIVSGDRVFTVETVKKYETVRAFDRASGRQVWEASWEGGTTVPFFAGRNGDWVRSTPAFDGQSLYVGGMRDLLVCLDAGTGKERWRVDFVERFKSSVPAFGFVCSPLVTADAVYVQAGGGFVRLDKATGRTVWHTLKDDGGMSGSAFSSPILAKVAGREQLLVQTRKQLAGVDAETGDKLWAVDVTAYQGMNILNPIPFGDGLFTSTYGGRTTFFQIGFTDGAFKPAAAWKLPIQGYMSTPVVLDGHAYLHRRDKRFSCVDLKAGKVKWTEKPGFSDYASLVTDGKKVLALDSGGELLLIRHNPEKLDLLDRKKVSGQETWAHLAVCGDELYIREQKGLAAYRWGAGPGK